MSFSAKAGFPNLIDSFLTKPSTSGGGPGEVLPIRGIVLIGMFIFFPVKENEPKETAVSRLNLRGTKGKNLKPK